MLLAAHLGAPRPALAALRSGRGNGQPPAMRRAACRPVRAFVAAEGEEKHVEATVTVHFTLTKKIPFGQELVVCGSAAQLGSWELGQALKMTWSEGDRWQATAELLAGAGLEWKFVQIGGDTQWESCLNRTLCVDAAAADLTCVWGAPLSTMVQPLQAAELLLAEEEGVSTDDDAPPPAFKPASALAQFADAVKQSFSSGGADAAAPAQAAPASLLAAAAEVLTADGKFDRKFDPLDMPAGAAAAALADKTKQQAADAPLRASPAPGKAVKLSPEAEAAVSSLIEAAGPTQTASSAAAALPGSLDAGAEAADEDEQAAATAALLAPAKPAAKGAGPDIKAIGKVAGTVAMGVGAAAMLSAFAVDIADVAVLGAVAAGSMAALSTPGSSSSGKKSKKGSKKASKRTAAAAAAAAEAAAGGEAEAVEVAAKEEGGREMISQKASAPGVILAASVLTAIDVGRKILASPDDDDSSAGGSGNGGSAPSDKAQ
ncbi:hypothetical protein ABPG75_011047 [Micractinium tetrahymenae]